MANNIVAVVGVWKRKNFNVLSAVVLVLLILILSLLKGEATAQTMSPMREEIRSFSNFFAFKVYPANPYSHRVRMEVKVYDRDFYPVDDALINPAEFTLGGNTTRSVDVVIPFNDGQLSRKVRVCTEAIPFPFQSGLAEKATTIKAQICGKFLGTRIRPSS